MILVAVLMLINVISGTVIVHIGMEISVQNGHVQHNKQRTSKPKHSVASNSEV